MRREVETIFSLVVVMDELASEQYRARMDALSPKERMARCTAMLKWSRDVISRQVTSELGSMPTTRLKLEVAKRVYRSDAFVCQLIDEALAKYSG